MGPYDYKPYSRDGLGFDWPMSYEDVEPYYDKTEMLIGVYGSNEGLENTPDSSPGVLQPPPPPRAEEMLTRSVCDDLDIPVVPAHLAIMTQRQDADRLARVLWPDNPTAQRVTADSMRSRSACFYATPCGRGCSIKANFQSPTVLLPPAVATGNLDIITDAMVREVTVDASGRATGVHYIDKTTRLDEHVQARVVILAASACESARIMLNSTSSVFPDGIGNGSGLVGKYVMDTVGAGVYGQVPALENMPPHNADGASAMHLYMPWWLYQEQARGQLDFARGYHIEFGGGRKMPGFGAFGGLEPLTGGSYGTRFKEDCRRYYGSFLGFDGRGEMIPNDDCYCEIDPDEVDQWGIPTLRFHWEWSEHELNQARHMQRTFAGILDAMGGRVLSTVQDDGADAIARPGQIIRRSRSWRSPGGRRTTSSSSSARGASDEPERREEGPIPPRPAGRPGRRPADGSTTGTQGHGDCCGCARTGIVRTGRGRRRSGRRSCANEQSEGRGHRVGPGPGRPDRAMGADAHARRTRVARGAVRRHHPGRRALSGRFRGRGTRLHRRVGECSVRRQ